MKDAKRRSLTAEVEPARWMKTVADDTDDEEGTRASVVTLESVRKVTDVVVVVVELPVALTAVVAGLVALIGSPLHNQHRVTPNAAVREPHRYVP